MRLRLQLSDRYFVTGKSGSGKTTLVQSLFGQAPAVWVLDWKLEDTWLGWNCRVTRSLDELTPARWVWRPPSIDLAAVNEFFRRALNTPGLLVIVDEAAGITSATKIQPWHAELIRMGRARGVGIVNCTQRPIGVHNLLISEANHRMIFRLNLRSDRAKLVDMGIECAAEANTLAPHYWYYHNDELDDGQLCAPVQLPRLGRKAAPIAAQASPE